jgi:four helix bundle suffix protein
MKTASPEVAANTLLCPVNQASFLLHRQIERDFLEHGGFTERMYAVRTQKRLADASDQSDMSDESDKKNAPKCPKCAKPMRLRTARQGPWAGSQFWGCSAYPDCMGVCPAEPAPGGSL